ncbi:MAG: serine/threonine protein kinase [Myxococcales bacterium]|nr:serine/threonine protein kinase [Myxococcales bacterium]
MDPQERTYPRARGEAASGDAATIGSAQAFAGSETLPAGRGPARTGAAEDGEALARGSVVGRYVILSRLGAGGMGVVYAAHDPELDRKVALKLLRGGADPADTVRLLREARALAKLAHPNIVAVHDAGTLAGEVFIAMEYVAGVTGRVWVEERARSLREVLEVYTAAGRGLAAAHRAGLVHRDFKPDNLMIGEDGRARVMDFGLARALDGRVSTESARAVGPGDLRLTREGSLLGTPAYMAPEQWQGGTVDARTDQFAFCVALWEALYGARPFRGGSMVELMSAVTEGTIARPNDPRRVPAWLGRVLERGLARAPERRFASMDALLAELERGLRRGRRRPLLVAAAAAAALVGGLYGARAQRAAACAAEGAAISAVWGEPARAELRTALVGTGLAYAETSFDHAAPYLDRWAAQWSETRAQVCREARVDGSRDEASYARATACLDEERDRLAALLAVYASRQDSPGHVERLVPSVADLPALSLCSEPSHLERRPTPPGDAERRAQIEGLRRELLAVWGALGAGDCKRDVAGLRARAEALGYGPLVIEAWSLAAEQAECAGDIKGAEEAWRRVYAEAEAQRADEVAARSAAELMRVIGRDRGRAAEALQWALPAESLVQRLGQERGLLAAEVLQSKALVLRSQGELAEALADMQAALVIREEVLGPEHPKVASTLLALARIHRSSNALEAALAAQTRAQAVRKAAYGAEHPDIATGANDLGLLEQSRGRYGEAELFFAEALKIAEEAHGPEHREVAVILNNLGRLKHLRGEYAEARRLLSQALAIREATLGASDLDVASTLHNLGLLEMVEGRRAGARAAFERVLKIRERKLDEDHPELVTILNDLGTLSYRMGDHAAALDLHTRALAGQHKRLPAGHRDIAMTMRHLALVRLARGEREEATRLAREALTMGEAALGAQHPDVATLLNTYGMALRRTDPARAEAALVRALAISVKTRGKKHLATATSLVRLGEVYADRRAFTEAQASFDEALVIREAVGADTPEVAEVLVRLGELAEARGAAAEAVAVLERAVKIREQDGVPREELAEARFALARALRATGGEARGRELATLALAEASAETRAAAERWLRGG